MKRRCAGAALVMLIVGVAAGCAAPARLPQAFCQTLPHPKVLYIAPGSTSESFAEYLRCKLPADVVFAPLAYSDLEFHHLCDKPLEETKQDTDYVAEQGRRFVDEQLARLKQFDVVIAQMPVNSRDEAENKRLRDIESRLVEHVRGGGKLVFINASWEVVFDGTPLADILPARFVQHKAWTYSPGAATDHPLTRGLPMETVGTHFYGPVYEPVDQTCTALTKGGPAAYWYRRLPEGGQVILLYQAAGGRWQWGSGTNYEFYQGDRPDEGLAWDAFCQRLIYWLAYGDEAFPVATKVSLPQKAGFRYGEDLAVLVDVENRSQTPRRIQCTLDVMNPRGGSHRPPCPQPILLNPGERKCIELLARGDALPWTDPHRLVVASSQDEQGRTLSTSFTWVPCIHAVPLAVKTDKATYAPGETVRATVAWAKDAAPGLYTSRVYMVDRRGRALHAAQQQVMVEAAKEGACTLDLKMPDWGPECAPSRWVTAVFCQGEKVLGTARAQVQLDRPWDMRQRFEWSVWTWGGGGRAVELMLDAGFNALGMGGNPYTADRYAMRQYVEGTGINTFGVTIDHKSWDEVRAEMEKTIDGQNKSGPDARSKSVVSLGEESGFKGGWGTRYYWDEAKAPEIPQKVFDDYLRELYGGKIEALNAEWGAQFKSFDEIPLERDKVCFPAQVFVAAQAWEAMQKKDEAKGRLPVDVKNVDPQRKYLTLSAPYYETYNFFDWYYQKYCDLATQVYRTRRNPVPLTIMSAPGGFYPKVDVYNFGGQGPFYPKENSLAANAAARASYGDGPGFSGAMWAYFDMRSLWSCTVLSSILADNTHIDYWVDFPLTFNSDLTHTRASLWTKELRQELRPIEPILLHKRVSYTPGLGMFIGGQPLSKGITGTHFGSAIGCNAPVYDALEKSGFMPKVISADELKNMKAVVASYAQIVSPDEAKKIAEFVRGGGLLVVTPWLASCSTHGNMLSVYPAEETGLRDLLGFSLLNTSQDLINEDVTVDLKDTLGIAAPLTLQSKGRDAVRDVVQDVQARGKYKDGTPLLLVRKVGQGRVVYLNFVFDWNGWWNAFYAPEREAYRRLMEALVRSTGLKPLYFLAFESAEPVTDSKGWWGMVMPAKPATGDSIAWWASQLYTDPSGRDYYLATFSDHRSPKITARLTWAEPGVRMFDLLAGKEIPTLQGPPAITLRPGDAAFIGITRAAPRAIGIEAPKSVGAGEPMRLRVNMPDADAAAGHGLVLDVYGPHGLHSQAHSPSNVTVHRDKGANQVEIPTAFNDAPGRYRIIATDSLTRARTVAEFKLIAPEGALNASVLTPFPPRASEEWPIPSMTSEQFIGELRKLRGIYEGTYQGLEAKYALSYYLDVPFRPDNRHAIMRRLQRTPWMPHLDAVTAAIRNGERFYLLGEDLNVDPASGLSIDPFAAGDPRRLVEQLADARGAKKRQVEAEGVSITIIEIGKGALVTGPVSVDRTAYHSSDFIAWHERLKAAVKAAGLGEQHK